MSIIYPSDKQIQASVHHICEKAPLTRRPNLISFLRDMSRNLGLRQIFTGTWDVILISCMLFGLAAVIGALDLRHSVNQLQKTSVFLFAFSPVFLFLLFSLSLWKEVEGTSYPIKMTCLYTARHLIAFRVFCITCCSFAVVGLYALFLSAFLGLPGLPLLCVSLSSLFLYSLLQIQTGLSVRSNLTVCGVLAVWVFGSCVGSQLWPEFCWGLLQAVPAVAWVLVDLLLALMFCNRYGIYVRRVCYAEGL